MAKLESLITPAFLKRMCRARLPWDRNERIKPAVMMNEFFGDDGDAFEAAQFAWPALIAFSEQGPHDIPDVWRYLPPLEDPAFPEQGFGMHIFLDIAPRLLFQGVDKRWLVWFDRVSQRFFQDLLELPYELRPFYKSHWPGASFEYWMCAFSEWSSAVTHTESVAAQETSVALSEELRLEVEAYSGTRDANRDDPNILKDYFAFPRVVTTVRWDDRTTVGEVGFFFCKVVDVHKPVIDHFGRYPYRNAVEGRDSTAEELDWIERTEHFGEVSPDIADKIRRDMAAGRWTPLGADKEVLARASLAINIHLAE